MRETAVDSDLNYLLPTLTSKLAKVHSIGHDELSVPTLAKELESRPRWRKTRVEGPQGQLSVPTLAKEPESYRRWRKTCVEELQSQVRTDTRTIEQTAKTDALGAPTPQPFPDCISEGEETNHLLRVLSIQAVTHKETYTACHGESQVKSQSDKSEQTNS